MIDRRTRRLPWGADTTTPFSLASERMLAGGRVAWDLSRVDPAAVGLGPSTAWVREHLARGFDPGLRPHPAGAPEAREAIARYYARRGAELSPDQLVLSASTSEAYTWLFKLLCEVGEAVAAPCPSYPLFDQLATLEGITLLPYQLLRQGGGWELDLQSVADTLAAGARAVLVVQPANPTGWIPSASERAALVSLCAEAGAALIVDEVFLDYGPAQSFAGEEGCLTFTLSGLSKVAALPQLKCGWIAASGPGAPDQLRRLLFAADAFLSVNGPVQGALPGLLDGLEPIQAPIRARLAANRDTLMGLWRPESAWDLVSAPAGWYALLRLPRVQSSEDWAIELLAHAGVLCHPGSFYGLPEAQLVLSLLCEEAELAEGVAALLDAVEAKVGAAECPTSGRARPQPRPL